MQKPIQKEKQLELPFPNRTFPLKDPQSDRLGPKASFFATTGFILVFLGGIAISFYNLMNLPEEIKKAKDVYSPENSTICYFTNYEPECRHHSKNTDDLLLYLRRLPHLINLENPKVAEIFTSCTFYLSTIPKGYSKERKNNSILGLWSNSERKIVLYHDSAFLGSIQNTAVHEFLHAAYDFYFEKEQKEELNLKLSYIKWLAMQFNGDSIPVLEERIGKLNPFEILFFQNLLKVYERYKEESYLTEMYSFFGEDTDIGIPAPLLEFYFPILSENYLSNHISNPNIRWDDIFYNYYIQK